MRIHIQNHPRQPAVFLVTPEQWVEATARAGEAGHGHEVSFGASEAEFAAVMPEVEVLISGPAALKHMLPDLQPNRAPALRLIFSTSAGIDGLAAKEMPPVPFANNRGAHAEKAAEFVIMALLMLANGMPECIEDQKNRHWSQRFTRGLRGRRLTVLGLGAMGGAAAEQAAHFRHARDRHPLDAPPARGLREGARHGCAGRGSAGDGIPVCSPARSPPKPRGTFSTAAASRCCRSGAGRNQHRPWPADRAGRAV